MPTTRITTRSIEAARKPSFLWDDKLTGFGCRIAADGRVSWLVQKKIGGRHGKTTRVVIGHCPPMDLTDARNAAAVALGDVAKGIDLPTKKRLQRETKRKAFNAEKLGDAVALYLRHHEAPGSYWIEVRRKFDVEIVPELGKDTRVCEITKADVRSLIEAKQSKGQHGAARYLFATLRPFFKWCVEREVFADVGGKSPIDGMKAPKPLDDRDRVFTDDEIKSFWSATASDELFGPFYRLLLLTAQRREEVGAMQWSEIKGDVWTLPGKRTKNGKTHIVHLSKQALAVIDKVPRTEGCKFLFSSTGKTAISGYGKAKARLDEAMGIVSDPDAEGFDATKLWRVHDLRRTARTRMAELKVPKEVASKILNHTPKGRDVDDVYQRFEYLDERKAALTKLGNFIGRLVANVAQENNVVAFART